MIICDTHVLLFWADSPKKLSKKVAKLIKNGIEEQTLACADISLWEISMLHHLGRIQLQEPILLYINDIVTAMKLDVLGITPEIAVLSQSNFFRHKDPADRLIGATAIHHRASLITKDKQLSALDAINIIW